MRLPLLLQRLRFLLVGFSDDVGLNLIATVPLSAVGRRCNVNGYIAIVYECHARQWSGGFSATSVLSPSRRSPIVRYRACPAVRDLDGLHPPPHTTQAHEVSGQGADLAGDWEGGHSLRRSELDFCNSPFGAGHSSVMQGLVTFKGGRSCVISGPANGVSLLLRVGRLRK